MVEKYKKSREVFQGRGLRKEDPGENGSRTGKGEMMGVMIPLWYAVCLGLAAAYFGFWFGRSRNWGLVEKMEAEGAAGNGIPEGDRAGYEGGSQAGNDGPGNGGAGYDRRKGRQGTGLGGGKGRGTAGADRRAAFSQGGDKYYGKNLFCPTGGRITDCQEGEERGVRILTTESRLYSPAAGRILKISPRGNAFLIRTDWGGDVTVRACTNEDDLLDRYFRPRVVRGEIVRRGRLLLEYDRETLCRKCQDTAVYVTVGDGQEGVLEVEEDLTVKVGDPIFWRHPEDAS